MDESFNRFLELKRGAAMHTLESLLLLPVRTALDSSSASLSKWSTPVINTVPFFFSSGSENL